MRTLSLTRPHMRGSDVEAWQRFLREHRFYRGSIDGDFGEDTGKATMAFQERMGIQPDGVVTPDTFERARRSGFSEPRTSRGPHYGTESRVELSSDARTFAERIANLYYRETGAEITITSGTRTAESQARAMYHNFRRGGRPRYRNHEAFQEILRTYDDARRSGADERATVAGMAQVIHDQMSRREFISRHLTGHAFDVRISNMTAAQRNAFERAVRTVTGHAPGTEEDHYHVEF